MKAQVRGRWLVVGGVVTAALTVDTWLEDNAAALGTDLVVAAAKVEYKAVPRAADSAAHDALSINLERLKTRDTGDVLRDPFASVPAPVAKALPAGPGAGAGAAGPMGAVAVAAPPGAPALPFTYMGKLISGQDLTVFLIQGERNLIVHEGDTIDALYRVEHIAEGEITLVYLPLAQRQSLAIGAAP